MSDYDMTFAKKILSDEDFDTIFGAEEDDRLMKALKESDDFVKDDPDTDGVEDGYGALGKGSGWALILDRIMTIMEFPRLKMIPLIMMLW